MDPQDDRETRSIWIPDCITWNIQVQKQAILGTTIENWQWYPAQELVERASYW